MKCLQATKLISQSHERPLKLSEKCGVATHIIICTPCRNFQRNCKQLSEMMKKFAKEE